jgi:hypothetical protein
MNWLSRFVSTGKNPTQAARRSRPTLEDLEERAVPSSTGVITSNFNGTAINPGSTVWFNSVVKVTGVGAAGATIHVDHSTLDYTVAGVTHEVAMPDATLVFSPTATTATTTFDTTTQSWLTTVSVGLGGNVFLSGGSLSLPGGLPGGANPVTWRADFESDTSGLSVNWQFGAAVYTQFSTDYNALDVKPVDSNSASVYKNSDHAGTPEAFKPYVTGGARGGGGSNWTGSYSATVSVQPSVGLPGSSSTGSNPTTASVSSLSGSVIDQTTGAGISDVTITLTTVNSFGQTVVVATTTTDVNGNYSFSNLPAGTYTITETLPGGFSGVGSVAGSAGGSASGDQITFTLGPGVNATGYNFLNVVPSL